MGIAAPELQSGNGGGRGPWARPTPLVFATCRGDRRGEGPLRREQPPPPPRSRGREQWGAGGGAAGRLGGVCALQSLGCPEKSGHSTPDCHPQWPVLGWSASPAPGRALPGAAVWDAGTRDVWMQDSGMPNEGCGKQGFEFKMRNVEMDGGCRVQPRPRFPQGWRPRGQKSCRSLCPRPLASARGPAGARDLGYLLYALTVISPS